MSEHSDSAKLDFILEMIEDVEFICKRHGGVTQALEDREGKPAILMSVLQMGETLKKISDETLKSALPIQGTYGVRNIIVHDYEGVDLALVENLVRTFSPELKQLSRQLLNRKKGAS